MEPNLRSGVLVLGRCFLLNPKVGHVVIIQHDGLEKIKRISKQKDSKVFVVGDNMAKSSDSHSFGWLNQEAVIAKVIWPRI